MAMGCPYKNGGLQLKSTKTASLEDLTLLSLAIEHTGAGGPQIAVLVLKTSMRAEGSSSINAGTDSAAQNQLSIPARDKVDLGQHQVFDALHELLWSLDISATLDKKKIKDSLDLVQTTFSRVLDSREPESDGMLRLPLTISSPMPPLIMIARLKVSKPF